MYYIYEIPGVKIGCTQDMARRQKEQRDKGEMVVLEYCTTIEEATRRERELQAEKGYPYDGNSYAKQLRLVEIAKDPTIVKDRISKLDYKAIHEKGAPKRRKYYDSFRAKNERSKKKIDQYSLDGKYIRSYNSIVEAGKHLNFPHYNIGACLRGRQKTACGYRWKYA